ncbi:Protein of unknown function- DUF538 [Striga hermonthica]|uniref:DUF538 family protein n=1 Tax=Striga hermonthica TaxID=68872 RepID=A0A9N7RQY6_STRHE|nr:Protein of unknown function- DUF538 [Striga hermonthica]
MRSALVLLAAVLICSSLPAFAASDEPSGSSIYEVLKNHGLPMGLLPKGVRNFSYDNSGKFQVHLDRACNAKFENELHYDMNVSGTIRYGQIDGLSGISARDLFLWLPVIEIRVDIPSSGLIYFNVSVVSKQFSLSSFETPRDCVAAPGPGSDLQAVPGIAESASKIRLGRLRYKVNQDNAAEATISEERLRSRDHISLCSGFCAREVAFRSDDESTE